MPIWHFIIVQYLMSPGLVLGYYRKVSYGPQRPFA
jgi:hypothetical protein